jgi:hypothetical protein
MFKLEITQRLGLTCTDHVKLTPGSQRRASPSRGVASLSRDTGIPAVPMGRTATLTEPVPNCVSGKLGLVPLVRKP